MRELAALLGVSEGAIRRALEKLAAEGEAKSWKEGRSQRWWASRTGARPDLGLPPKVTAIVAQVSAEEARKLGGEQSRKALLGLIGSDETLVSVGALWRLLYKLDFEERVERPLLGRLFGPSHDERLGSLYIHPHNFGVVTFTTEEGLRFIDLPEGPASAIRDFDGVVQTNDVSPAHLSIDEADWKRRRSPEEASKRFTARFEAQPKDVTPIFVPLWELVWKDGDGLRRVFLDAIAGKPVRWLGPDG